MRILTASLLLLVLALTGLMVADAATHHHPGRRAPVVTMSVAIGYDEQYRSSAWTPVRVTLHNRTDATISGTLEIPAGANNGPGPPQPFSSLYSAAVVLPGGGTKQVTLYVQGTDVAGNLEVRFRSDGRTLASGSDNYVNSFQESTLIVGALTGDPMNTRWVKSTQPTGGISIARLSAATLDPLPDALASFDVIVLSNVDTSRLAAAQLSALQQYVRNGGTLLLVGGPDWQETLRPLPAALVPGQLTGSRTVSDLSGLRSLGYGAPPARQTTITVLRNPQGSVLAAEGGVPLAVRESLGKGSVMYLAFDPAVEPVAQWSNGASALTRLVSQAAPYAVGRSGWSSGGPPIFFGKFYGPFNIAVDLSNVPAAALPSLLLFILLTVLYIVLLGPANFLVLRRFGRRELSWISVPALALACVGSTFGVAYHLKGNTVLINTIGVVQLDGDHGPYPATLYSGLFAPVRGDYTLTYGAPALPAAIPQMYDYGPGPPPSSKPLGLRFQEGAQTHVTFLRMNMWSMRDVTLRTSVDVPGHVQSSLQIDAAGDITGTVHNGTSLTLLHPAIIAGRQVAHLRDLAPGATVRVKVRPSIDVHDRSPFWLKVFGQPSYQGMSGPGIAFVGFRGLGGPLLSGPWGGGCCPGPAPPTEHTLSDRIRNAGSMLPETQTLSTLGEVLLTGWSEQPLGSMTVDGSSPQRRDLNLVEEPLQVRLPAGPFALRSGTIGAQLVDDVPAQPTNGCCPWNPMVASQPIMFGSGGSATFQFDIPHAGRVHFSSLTLWADAGGADGTHIGSVYDWRRHVWVPIDLSLGDAPLHAPDRFLSPDGRVLVKIRSTGDSGDVTIMDPHLNLQLSGKGIAT